MSSLHQRLASDLIGTTTDVTALIGNTEAAFAVNRVREGQRSKLQEVSHSVLEDMLAIVGEDEYNLELKHGDETDDVITETAAIRNELKAKIRAALTAYCIGEGEKSDAH